MNLIATEAFPYAGVQLKAGDPFTAASATDAQLLVTIGKARRNGVETRELDAETADETDSRPKRRYKRRDMAAES